MKRLLLLVFTVLCTQLANSQCPVPIITSPNGGEVLTVGQVYNVQYYYGPILTGTQVSSHVIFHYTLNDGTNWTYLDSIPVDSSLAQSASLLTYPWLVPNTITDSCRIKIERFAGACWDESDLVFRIIRPTSTEDMGAKSYDSIEIYPNPVNQGSEITIDLVDRKFEQAILYDSSGRLMVKKELRDYKFQINTSELTKGVYFLTLTNEKEAIARKIVIN